MLRKMYYIFYIPANITFFLLQFYKLLFFSYLIYRLTFFFANFTCCMKSILIRWRSASSPCCCSGGTKPISKICWPERKAASAARRPLQWKPKTATKRAPAFRGSSAGALKSLERREARGERRAPAASQLRMQSSRRLGTTNPG